MELINITTKTLIPQIPGIIEKNNKAIKGYLDIFYDESLGILIKPVNTTGRVKGGSGEFVNLVVDNLTVKNQYTNLYDNVTTADKSYYTAYTEPAIVPRDYDPSTSELAGYKYIDVSKPYYKITNDSSIVLNSNNLSQVVRLIFDVSTSTSNYDILLNPKTEMKFSLPVADASTTYVELILTDYDSSWGGYWSLYKFGNISNYIV